MKLGSVSWANLRKHMRVHPAGLPGQATEEDIVILNESMATEAALRPQIERMRQLSTKSDEDRAAILRGRA